MCRRVSTAMAADFAAAGQARRLVLEAAAVWHLGDEVAWEAAAVVGELVSNAVLHGAGRPVVELGLSRFGLDVAVADEGPGAPVMGRPAAEDLHGRGLFVVAELSDEWRVDPLPAGKVVWARFAAASSGPDCACAHSALSSADDQSGQGAAAPTLTPSIDAPVSAARVEVLAASAPAEVAAAVRRAVRELGGTVVAASEAASTALPLDISLGLDAPALPDPDGDPVALLALETLLPPLVEDAREAVRRLAATGARRPEAR